jgi:hypothetical protein
MLFQRNSAEMAGEHRDDEGAGDPPPHRDFSSRHR